MDLISRLKAAKVNSRDTTIPEIDFLEKSDINLILNRGFTELYRANPENPVKFLSKWLLKESKSKELEQKYKEEELKKQKLQIKHFQQEKIKETKRQQDLQLIKIYEDKKLALINQIEGCTEFWDNFGNFCENLKGLINATGVYMGLYDLKRRPVSEDDDDMGHIHPSNTKVIRYIAWCKDHDFLHGKCLEANQGVTYTLFQPNTAQVDPNAPQDGGEGNPNPPAEQAQVPNPGDKKEEKKDEELPTLLIDDVVLEPRMKFFREPRLGCYLAIDITYKTSLSYASLVSAIKASKEYKENKEKQEERYREWSEQREQIEKEIEELKKEKEKEEEEKKLAEQAQEGVAPVEGGEEKKPEEKKEEPPQQPPAQPQPAAQPNPAQGQNPPQPGPNGELPQDIQTLQNMLTEWTEEPVKMADYVKEDKKIILALDTMGQDRVFTKEEMEFIKKFAKTIQTSLQAHEQKLLEKDRDIRMKFEEEETELKAQEDFGDEKFELLCQNAINDYYSSEEFKEKQITDETLKAIEGDVARAKHLSEVILRGKVQDLLLTFENFEFVEYEKIFQNLFYFAHTEPLSINEPETNKLEWKRARASWKDIFPYIMHYEPRGPKPDQVKNIFKLNKIKENLESAIAKREEVKEYSFTLLLLVDYILLLIKIRHDDIVQRTNKVLELRDEREKIIAANKEIEDERNKIIEQAKALNPQPAEGEVPADGSKPAVEGQPPVEEQQPPAENQPVVAQPPVDGQPQEPGFNLEEELAKFDAEHPKAEVPPEVEFDLDLDYDIKN